MIVIDRVIISDDIKEKEFACNLKRCKGACCVEGDSGAPLESEELEILERDYDKIKSKLTKEGQNAIRNQGKYILHKKTYKTPLINDKACAYVHYGEGGVAQCGIELAYLEGKTKFRKPVSCHLYPLRVKKYDDFEAINYDRWDICSPACELGKKMGVPLYEFVKDGLIRKYGEEFYTKLVDVITSDV